MFIEVRVDLFRFKGYNEYVSIEMTQPLLKVFCSVISLQEKVRHVSRKAWSLVTAVVDYPSLSRTWHETHWLH